MKLCAIICEYNPFHNGHKYHIEESLKLSGCDAALCIMGGNFSQRGQPTITDKYTRAQMAIMGGAAAVVQIPTYYCTANAEIFAKSAIKIACSFKNVTHISFGSECGDVRSLAELAKFLNKEPIFFKNKIKANLNMGYSLGKSKTLALNECIEMGLVKFTRPEVVAKILDSPNNILGVEYLKAMMNSDRQEIMPITVKRTEDSINADLEHTIHLSSSTAIRESVYRTKRIWNIKKYVPNDVFKLFSYRVKLVGVPDRELWGNIVLSRMRTASPSELRLYYDVTEGIENKLITASRENVEYDEFIDNLESRRFTKARLQRVILACLLGLRSEFVKSVYDIEKLPYIKLLATKNDKELLAALSECNTILVSRKQDAVIAQKDPLAKILMFAEDKANALYSLLLDLIKEQQKEFAKSDIYQKTLFIK